MSYAAFTLWSAIDGQARAWARRYDVAHTTSTRALLQAVAARVDAPRDGAQIVTGEYEHLVAPLGRADPRPARPASIGGDHGPVTRVR